MYQKQQRHPELIRLIGAAAVSKRFSQMLLRNPKQILEHGYLGYRFNLTAEEAVLVSTTPAKSIQEFSLQVWEWLDHKGNGGANGGHPAEELPQTTWPFESALSAPPVSSVPASVEEEKKPAHRAFAPEPASLSWNGRKGMGQLILIVDDNQEMAEGLRFALEAEGFQVVLTSDGELAAEFLEHRRPDLILADIKMPRMDGYTLLRLVKQNAKWRNIPFVFVTAAADWREAVMAKSMGAEEYVVKPFELEDLTKVVRRLTKETEGAEEQRIGEKRQSRNR